MGPTLEVQDPVNPFAERLEQFVAGFSEASADYHGFSTNDVHALADGESKGINGIVPNACSD
ncbi:hypothetical protein D3C72_2478500 [compost metagenome]